MLSDVWITIKGFYYYLASNSVGKVIFTPFIFLWNSLKFTLDFLWELLLLIPKWMPLSILYLGLSLINLHLFHTESLAGGLRYITYITSIEPLAVILFFAGMSQIVPLIRNPNSKVFATLTLPIIIYTSFVFWGTFTGQINSLGWLATLYISAFSLQLLLTIRNDYYEERLTKQSKRYIETLTTRITQLEKKLEDRWTPKA